MIKLHRRQRTATSSSSMWQKISTLIWQENAQNTAMATTLRCKLCVSCIIAQSKFINSALVRC